MSTHTTPTVQPTNIGGSVIEGARFTGWDEAPDAYLDILPQDTGNLEIEIGNDESGEGLFYSLPAEHRALAAAIIAGESTEGEGKPVRNPGRFRVILETGGDDWQLSPEEFDKVWARAGWHVRNGLAGFARAGEGTLSINEVAPNGKAPRGTQEEVRRHYRYRVEGDAPDAWKFHHSHKFVQAQDPIQIQFQRTYKSDWEAA